MNSNLLGTGFNDLQKGKNILQIWLTLFPTKNYEENTKTT